MYYKRKRFFYGTINPIIFVTNLKTISKIKLTFCRSVSICIEHYGRGPLPRL